MVNKEIINEILNEKKLNDEVSEIINNTVDSELEKPVDEIDCDLIEECTDALLEINGVTTESFEVTPFDYSAAEKSEDKTNSRRVRILIRALIVAAIILATTVTASAAVKKATGNSIMENLVSVVNKRDSEAEQSATEEETSVSVSTNDPRGSGKNSSRSKSRETGTTKKTESFEGRVDRDSDNKEDKNKDVTEATAKPIYSDDSEEEETSQGDDVITQSAEPDISYPSDESEKTDSQ